MFGLGLRVGKTGIVVWGGVVCGPMHRGSDGRAGCGAAIRVATARKTHPGGHHRGGNGFVCLVKISGFTGRGRAHIAKHMGHFFAMVRPVCLTRPAAHEEVTPGLGLKPRHGLRQQARAVVELGVGENFTDTQAGLRAVLRWVERKNLVRRCVEIGLPLKDGKPLGGSRPSPEYLPVSTDWLGRYRVKANASNDWLIDREAQRTKRIYSGIDHIGLQDQAVTESMGAITNHSLEHLGPGDLMIARTRRRALQAARAFRDGTPAPNVDAPEVFMGARSGYFEMHQSVDWQKAYAERMLTATRVAQVNAKVAVTVKPPEPAMAK